ncbi:MAG: hypothetical protein KY391_06250 [Actinobacteria bacterium]|nr:hypothetical protein [Actinomycetota bacterium]
MKKVLLVALAVSLSCFAPTASATDVEVGGRVVSGGGTPVSNGLFFPGTAIPDGDGGLTAILPPIEIERGTDLEFTNIDEAAVSNAHKIVSLKRRKGRPLFQSKTLTRPGQSTLVATSNLKPGLYPFYCSVHSGMWAQLKVVR